MIFRWFAPTPRDLSIPCLYGAIVAQARQRAFYEAYGVPDTVTGRLEMIMLHLILVLRHFQQPKLGRRNLGQALFDRFCCDMDDNMREMGVGDLAVPRKMRLIGAAFYARQTAYGTALAGGGSEEKLSAALARHVYGGHSEVGAAARLAGYCRGVAEGLAGQDRFDHGTIRFPDPEQVHAAAQS
ncbi:MAG TPA: ubiquinol-cytochrome C chaperone family protein [Xanthobacteraceae bacterium]|jgi:cytochrome b pre-mRNA-processing protein 3